jgi:cell division protein FtsL
VEEVVRRRRRTRTWSTPSLLALGFASLLASLSFVTWRQSRAFEALAALDEVRRELSLAEAEQTELERRIQRLESRSRISTVAAERLGMHQPDAAEMVLLSGVAP